MQATKTLTEREKELQALLATREGSVAWKIASEDTLPEQLFPRPLFTPDTSSQKQLA